jgi:acyl-CoA thioesterase-1
MRRLTILIAAAALAAGLAAPAGARPPPDYAAENAALGPPAAGERRIVFTGDSTTLFWRERDKAFFMDRRRINRGVGAATTAALLARFNKDVLSLKPAVVHIMGGINDIARNNGAVPADTRANLLAMAAAAQARGARVIIGSVLPCSRFNFYPDQRPAAAVIALNKALREEATRRGYIYADYHAVLADAQDGMAPVHSSDGLHPTAAGYRVMDRVASFVIADALEK